MGENVGQRNFKIGFFKIDNCYRSDHTPVIFSFKIFEFIKDSWLWQFNKSLLHYTDYAKKIKIKPYKYVTVKEQYICRKH